MTRKKSELQVPNTCNNHEKSYEISALCTSMVIGVKTKRLVRLKAKAASRNPIWYFSEVVEVFHGCRYPKAPIDTAQHTPTIEK